METTFLLKFELHQKSMGKQSKEFEPVEVLSILDTQACLGGSQTSSIEIPCNLIYTLFGGNIDSLEYCNYIINHILPITTDVIIDN